jgi:hypothetical protein
VCATIAMSASELAKAARFSSLSRELSVFDRRSTLPSAVVRTFSSRALSEGLRANQRIIAAIAGAQQR